MKTPFMRTRIISLFKGANHNTIRPFSHLFRELHTEYKKRQQAYAKLDQKAHATIDAKKDAGFGAHTKIYDAQPKTAAATAADSKQPQLMAVYTLNAENPAAPRVYHHDGTYAEISALSSDPIHELMEALSDSVSITLGYRLAFNGMSPIPVTHAVILIRDSTHHHAIYGYSMYHKHSLVNDLHPHHNGKEFKFYNHLTIHGNLAQTKLLIDRINHYSLKYPYTLVTNNCYTPLIAGLMHAKELGFKTTEFFTEALLVALPVEHNFGAGVATNKDLRPQSTSATDHILKK